MTEEDKIVSRIRKMMAIANDAAASEGERDNAMRMALKLLAKHNLSMKQIDASVAPEERGKTIMSDRNDPWARQVAGAIARLFFCKYYYVPYTAQTRCEHNFIGLESNTVTAMEITKYVLASIRAEAAKYVRETGIGTPRDFCKGATLRIHARCEALRKEAEQESAAEATPGTALVLASVYQQEQAANDAFLEAMNVKLKSSKDKQRAAGSSGFWAGHEYGGKVSLNRQVGGAKAAAMLS
jgi:hypothetical protein